jgi:DNA topoisomerase-1
MTDAWPLLKRCMELPGQALFQYLDDDGQRHSIGSSEVNQFLQQLTGADFTAKDYRTWAGSSLALSLLSHWPGSRTAKPNARSPR